MEATRPRLKQGKNIFMAKTLTRFDEEIQRAMENIVKNEFERAKMQMGSIESRLKKQFKETKSMGKLNEIRRIRLIQAGLFNKKVKHYK